jgi:hypothetical protein
MDTVELEKAKRSLSDFAGYDWLTKSDQPFFGSDDLADHLGVTRAAVSMWCKAGDIPGAALFGNTWRIPREGLIIFCYRRMQAGQSGRSRKVKQPAEAREA